MYKVFTQNKWQGITQEARLMIEDTLCYMSKVDKAFYTKEKLHCRVKKRTGTGKVNTDIDDKWRFWDNRLIDYGDAMIRKGEWKIG